MIHSLLLQPHNSLFEMKREDGAWLRMQFLAYSKTTRDTSCTSTKIQEKISNFAYVRTIRKYLILLQYQYLFIWTNLTKLIE